MQNKLKVFLISMLAVTVTFSFIFEEFLWELLLVGLVSAKNMFFKLLIISKKFFFKDGVVSFATIAWKHVFVTSAIALGKRAFINTIVEFFNKHIANPLIHPLSRYLKIRWRLFKTYNLWQKFYTVIASIIPATLMLWIVGILDAIMLLLKSFSLAKFLTVILKLMTLLFLFLQNIWRTWVQPYIDYILITILLGLIEKIPVVGKFMRRMRIMLRWKWRKLRFKRRELVNHHVDKKVHLMGERIHKHVNKQKEVMKAQLGETAKVVENSEEVTNKITPDSPDDK